MLRHTMPRTQLSDCPSMRQLRVFLSIEIVALLNRCVEGIHVAMDDFADTHMVTMFFRAPELPILAVL
jgi:hypothetical protein